MSVVKYKTSMTKEQLNVGIRFWTYMGHEQRSPGGGRPVIGIQHVVVRACESAPDAHPGGG